MILLYLLRMKNLFVAVIRHTGASASSVAAALLPAWAMPMAAGVPGQFGAPCALRGEVYGLQRTHAQGTT